MNLRKCFVIKELLFSILENYSGLGILVLLFLEYVGFPIPGETLMSALGFMSAQDIGYSLYINILFASAGAFLGYTFAYFIGYKYGEKFLLKHKKFFHINEERLDSLNRLFNKHKILLIVFSRYILGVRHIVPYLCGISKMDFRVFTVYNLIGSLVWCTSFLGLGYFVGERWDLVVGIIETYILILILLSSFIFIVFRYLNKYSKIIFLITVPLMLFIFLIRNLIEQKLSIFDNKIYSFISSYMSDGMTHFMISVSFLGSWIVFITIVIVGVLVFWKNKSYSFYGKLMIVNLIASYILNIIFKTIFQRERPDILQLVEISGFSFPSGHSMVGIGFYGFILYLCYVNLKSKWKYLLIIMLILLILLIGISRIYLGVHYPSDVLAGYLAGLTWLAIFITLTEKISSKVPNI